MGKAKNHKNNRYNEGKELDHRFAGYRRRALAQMKGTETMPELLKAAKVAKIPARDVLSDSWSASSKTTAAKKCPGYDVVAMIRKLATFLFGYEGKTYKRNRKRRGRFRDLLSVQIPVKSGKKSIPAKVVCVRNRNDRQE